VRLLLPVWPRSSWHRRRRVPRCPGDPAAVPTPKRTQSGAVLYRPEAAAFLGQTPPSPCFSSTCDGGRVRSAALPCVADPTVPHDPAGFPDWDRREHLQARNTRTFCPRCASRMRRERAWARRYHRLICRSGDRSAGGVNLLLRTLSSSHVYPSSTGSRAIWRRKDRGARRRRRPTEWKNAVLPWSYTLDPVENVQG